MNCPKSISFSPYGLRIKAPRQFNWQKSTPRGSGSRQGQVDEFFADAAHATLFAGGELLVIMQNGDEYKTKNACIDNPSANQTDWVWFDIIAEFDKRTIIINKSRLLDVRYIYASDPLPYGNLSLTETVRSMRSFDTCATIMEFAQFFTVFSFPNECANAKDLLRKMLMSKEPNR